ncbi:hypothetical protein GCM10027168_18510 [Streptomyces capparidis]
MPSPADPPDSDDDGLAALPDLMRVDPAVLCRLLARHGWQRRGGVPGRYSRWTPPPGARPSEPGISLLVPQGNRLEDHAELLGEALTALARSGTPSARRILLRLALPGDEIRWRRRVPGAGGAVTWNNAERLWSGARAMLMAAARADCVACGHFGERLAGYAECRLEQILVGPSPGGHVLTAYAPVPASRRITVTLLRGLRAVRDAVDHRRATGSMTAFEAAVALGACQELLDSVVRLVRDTAGVEVLLSWSPTAGAPLGFPDRVETVAFSPADLPVLTEAGARYVAAEPSVPVRITGQVERLHRPGGGGPGTVRLRVLSGADVARVRARLDEEGYRVAANAHLTGLPVRVSGRLESRGGFRALADVREVVPVPIDDGERQRLLKALRGQAELVERACEPQGSPASGAAAGP